MECFCSLLCYEPEGDLHLCEMISYDLTFNPHLLLPTPQPVVKTKTKNLDILIAKMTCVIQGLREKNRGFDLCPVMSSQMVDVLKVAIKVLQQP